MTPPLSYFQVGPLTITIYGVIVTFAVTAGFLLARHRAPLYKITPGQIDDLLLPLLIGAVIGARLYHVIDQWHYYQHHLSQVFAVWQGGIGIYGAIGAGLIVVYWFCRRHRRSFLTMTDLLAPSMLLGQAIGRWGNFFNQEAFGPPTNLPWKIYIDPTHRPSQWFLDSYFHPLFLYESLWNIVGFGLSLWVAKHSLRKPGGTFGFYLLWYGFGRLLVESFRHDTATIGPIKIAAIVSAIFVITGMFLLRSLLPFRHKTVQ